eukprot:jgi/Botrbrau1/22593/Bobra.176_1s0023.1
MPGDGSGRNPGAKPDTSQGLSTGQQGNATGSAQFQEGGGLFKKQNVAVGLAGSGRPLLGSAEFQTAWQLEVWKRSEQVKWRAAMEKEQSERLKALEAEWAAKEAARAAEWERWRVTQRNLQQRARQLVMAGEGPGGRPGCCRGAAGSLPKAAGTRCRGPSPGSPVCCPPP